ncbi:GNAT family N-acetyltransferase [Paenibacillus wenxiniae]|uniref:GNAT family N-acetyltransferase n=1 Tax=Paenibacillus wenxiniae TaxID=1636843 RepID=A0ABW4RGX5_9BACL
MNPTTELKHVTTIEQLELAKHIRQHVFVEEQGVPLEDEFDDYDRLDAACTHLLVYYNEQLAGTGRWRLVDGTAKLERICLLPEFRKYGLGRFLIDGLEQQARKQGLRHFQLHGQSQAAPFYEKLGYRIFSVPFMEDGIEHVWMIREV